MIPWKDERITHWVKETEKVWMKKIIQWVHDSRQSMTIFDSNEGFSLKMWAPYSPVLGRALPLKFFYFHPKLPAQHPNFNIPTCGDKVRMWMFELCQQDVELMLVTGECRLFDKARFAGHGVESGPKPVDSDAFTIYITRKLKSIITSIFEGQNVTIITIAFLQRKVLPHGVWLLWLFIFYSIYF